MPDTPKTLLDENYEAFQAMLPTLLAEHRGRFAVIYNRELDAVFDTARDAFVHASRVHQPGTYAIQEITDLPLSLGFYSHAVPRQYL